MELEKQFRKLVTTRFNPFVDYSSHTFAFKTLFYQSPHSYCCCICSFEHEYLAYVSDTGVINEQVYEKVIQNIKTGACPHTENVSRKYIRETKIHALHIAAAIDKAVKNVSGNLEHSEGTIYGLRPSDIAIMKNSYKFLRQYYNEYRAKSEEGAPYYYNTNSLRHGYKPHEKKYNVIFEHISPLDLCIRNKRRQLFTLLLDPGIIHCQINKSFELIFEDERLSDMLEDCLVYIRQFRWQFRASILERCAVSAIVYENDYALNNILLVLKTCKVCDELQRWFPYICKILGKIHQKEIVTHYKQYPEWTDAEYFKLKTLHYLLNNYHDKYPEYIKLGFQRLSGYKSAVDDDYNNCAKKTPLHLCFDRYSYTSIKPRKAAVLLQFGAELDVLDIHGQTPLIELLSVSGKTNIQDFMYGLGLLMVENPDVFMNKSAVTAAINLDERFENGEIEFLVEGTYVMDAKQRSVFSSDETFEMKFLGPLLIECGFYYNRDILLDALEKNLHRFEKDYIKWCLDNPRSLKLCCRDTLRRHFKRRQIHKFVEGICVPDQIKDYILIKPYLLFNEPLD